MEGMEGEWGSATGRVIGQEQEQRDGGAGGGGGLSTWAIRTAACHRASIASLRPSEVLKASVAILRSGSPDMTAVSLRSPRSLARETSPSVSEAVRRLTTPRRTEDCVGLARRRCRAKGYTTPMMLKPGSALLAMPSSVPSALALFTKYGGSTNLRAHNGRERQWYHSH